jgi:PAS domain-containing protein
LRAANSALAPFADRIRLDDASLIAAAQKRAKLHDFGPDTFRDGLSALTESLDREAGLSPLGRMLARQLVVQLLVTRLRLFELLRLHPEIADEPVEAPIFIIGLPRTGTTHLHTAMSHDERLRSMPYWESLDPIPDPHAAPRPEGKADPRIARCAQGLRLVHYGLPLMPAMHEMTAEGPHEEIQLLAVAFETMFFEAGYNVPSYVDWYRSHDQTDSYRLLRTMLQAMQWLRGGRRWVLKSPQHLEQLRVLLDVFPDAVVVQTHRDPVAVTASLVTMEAYLRRMQHSGVVDLHAIGAHWSGRIEEMLRASVEDRAHVPEGRVLDVAFHEFMADQMGTIERIEKSAGLDFDHTARRSVGRFLDEHPRGKHGTITYDLARFGIDADERRQAFRFYTDLFDLPLEA